MQNPLKLVDRRSLLVLIGAFTVATLVAVIIIVLTISGKNRSDAQADAERRQNEHQAITSSTSFGMEDYYLDSRDPDVGIVYPVRSPQSFWSSDEVDEYWIDPAEAGLETLSTDNDQLIYDSLGIDGNGK